MHTSIKQSGAQSPSRTSITSTPSRTSITSTPSRTSITSTQPNTSLFSAKDEQEQNIIQHRTDFPMPRSFQDHAFDKNTEIEYSDKYQYSGISYIIFTILLLGIPLLFSKLINEGHVGLVMNNGKPEILKPGWHIFLNPFVSFIGEKKISDRLIENETIKIVNVPQGRIGITNNTKEGRYKLLMPGRYFINSADEIIYKDAYGNMILNDLDQELIIIDTTKIVRILPNQVGIVNRMIPDSNTLRQELIGSGSHIILPPDEYVTRLNTSRQAKKVNAIRTLSKDQLPVEVHAELYYQIINPQLAIEKCGSKNVDDYVMQNAFSNLGEIIRSSTFSLGEVGNSFTNTVHDSFMNKFKKELEEFGIEINDLRINESKVTNPEVERRLTENALLINQCDAQVQSAKNKAQASTIDAQNKADIILLTARANAEAAKIQAQGMLASAAILDKNEFAQKMAITELTAKVLGANAKVVFAPPLGSSTNLLLSDTNQ